MGRTTTRIHRTMKSNRIVSFEGSVALSARLTVLLALILLGSAPALQAQVVLTSPPELEGVGKLNRISGANLRAGFIELRPDLKADEEGQGQPRVLDTAPVAQDAWTAIMGETDGNPPDTLENENYFFTQPTSGFNQVTFCIALKIPRSGLPNQLFGDLVIIPATPRNGGQSSDMPPAPVPNLFIDDIQFGDPGPGNQARPVVAFLDLELLESQIGATGRFDWFIVLDFAGNLASDDDGNQFPDIAIEANQGNVSFKLTNTLDQVGADVVDFFTGNVNKVNVFESRGAIPSARAGFPGMLNGEDGTTRPWAFILQ